MDKLKTGLGESLFVLLAIFICVNDSLSDTSTEVKKENSLSQELNQVLNASEKAVLYSLEPQRTPSANERFYGFLVLGSIPLTKNQTTRAVKAFKEAIAQSKGYAARCFEPRHALHLTSSSHVYDFLLCYHCLQMEVYKDGKMEQTLLVGGDSNDLNALMTETRIPISTSDIQKTHKPAISNKK
ncbi:MAG: hypothetical protein JWQ35_544 [Bacteriovoracaceae bacterium]|nr:hypothetical protein [Bacteriovoracaceae bacterium]